MKVKNGAIRDVPNLLALDYAIFPEDWHLPVSFVEKIIRKNPNIYRVLHVMDKIKGYYCLYPMLREPYDLLLKGELKETDLERFIVDYTKPREVCLYLLTIIVDINDPSRKQYSKCLIHDIPQTLKSTSDKGMKIEEMGAIAISTDGERILKRLGMEPKEDISEKLGTRGIVYRCGLSDLKVIPD